MEEQITISLRKYPIVSAWLKHKSLSSLAEKRGVSRQRMKVLFDREIEEIKSSNGFNTWMNDLLFNEDCTLFPFYSFQDVRYGKILGYILKKEYQYTMLQHFFLLKRNTGSYISPATIKKDILKKIGSEGSLIENDTTPVGGFYNIERFIFTSLRIIKRGEVLPISSFFEQKGKKIFPRRRH